MCRSKKCVLWGTVLFAVSLLVSSGTFVTPAFAATQKTDGVAAPAASSPCPPTQNNGASGTWVRVIQYRLNVFYHYYPNMFSGVAMPLSVDGGFGPKTLAAVKTFQYDSGITQDGSVGTNTWGYLGFCSQDGLDPLEIFGGTPFTSAPPTIMRGSSGIWVQALQFRLNALHQYDPYLFPSTPQYTFYYPLATDGSFGPQTDSTVRAFQYDITNLVSGTVLTVDGQVGQHTWAALGMC